MPTIKIKLVDPVQGYRTEKVEWVSKHWVENDCLVLAIRKPGLYNNPEQRNYPMHNILMWSVEG